MNNQKKNTLTFTAMKNVSSALLMLFAKIVLGLVTAPIFVNGLGDLNYGVLQLLNKFFGYLSAADARPTQALKWVIANNQSQEKDIEKRKAIACAIRVWLLMLPIMMVIGALLIYYIPIIIDSPINTYSINRLASAIMLLNILLSGIAMIPGAVLRGMNRAHKGIGIMLISSILGSLLMVLAVIYGFGLIGVVTAYVLQTLLTGLLMLRLLKKNCTWLGIVDVTWKETFCFWKTSIWYSIWSIVSKLNTSSTIVLVGIFISAEVVTSLSLSSYATNTSLVVFSVILGAILPGIGNHFSSDNYKAIRNVRKELLLISFLLATVMGSIVLSLNEAFTTVWVGSERYIGNSINLLLLLNTLMMLYIRNESMLIDITLDVKQKSMIGLASIAVTVLFAIILYHSFSILGICIATLIGRIPMAIGYSKNLNKELQGNDMEITQSVRPFLTLASILLISYFARPIMTHYAVDWLHLIISVAGVTMLTIVIAFYVGCNDSFRKQLITRIHRMGHK